MRPITPTVSVTLKAAQINLSHARQAILNDISSGVGWSLGSVVVVVSWFGITAEAAIVIVRFCFITFFYNCSSYLATFFLQGTLIAC